MYHHFTIILSFKTINKSWKTNILIIGTVFNNWLNSSHQNRGQSLWVARPCRCLYMFIQNNLKPNVFNNLNELVCKVVLLILKVGSHRLLRLVLLLIFSSCPISSRFQVYPVDPDGLKKMVFWSSKIKRRPFRIILFIILEKMDYW